VTFIDLGIKRDPDIELRSNALDERREQQHRESASFRYNMNQYNRGPNSLPIPVNPFR